MGDSMKHKSEEAKGTAKRKAGEVTDDPELAAEGRADEGKSKAKQAGERAADSAGDAAEAARDKARQAFDRDR